MTWFGTVSAVAALLMGAMFGVNAYFQFATGVSWWLYVLTAALLLVGGFRTLRKMSGGLRLLGGAWGFAAGLLAAPFTMPRSSEYYVVSDVGGYAILAIALLGLALTVLHKETKA
jgi:hypothetical protein